MGIKERTWATIVIWIAVASILITAVSQPFSSDLDIVALAFVLVLGGAASTVALWRSVGQPRIALHEVEKNKRRFSPRIARLIDELDDEEAAQLSDLLTARGQENRHDDARG